MACDRSLPMNRKWCLKLDISCNINLIEKMKKEKIFLKIYSITLTAVMGYILLSGFIGGDSAEPVKEITVERINIVEPDGTLKMVISNKARQHPGMMDGKIYGERERPPGILFFNEEQDEVGGLSFYGNKNDGNNQFLSFDQYKNDQVMHLSQNTDQAGDTRYGLQLWERDKEMTTPVFLYLMDSLDKEGYYYRQKLEILKKMNGGEPILAQRLFIGRNYNRETGLFIQDKHGTDRLRLYVDTANNPRIEVLDEKGTVTQQLLHP